MVIGKKISILVLFLVTLSSSVLVASSPVIGHLGTSAAFGWGQYMNNGYGAHLELRSFAWQDWVSGYIRVGTLNHSNELFNNSVPKQASHIPLTLGFDMIVLSDDNIFFRFRLGEEMMFIDRDISDKDYYWGGILGSYFEYQFKNTPSFAVDLGVIWRLGYKTEWKARNRDLFNGVGSEMSLRYIF